MISALGIRNFKCFQYLRLPLSPLTLLTGFNAGGKSSAIQPLLLLAQMSRNPARERIVPLNGPLVRLGAVGDVLPTDTVDPLIEIEIFRETSTMLWIMEARAGDRFLRVTGTQERMFSDQAPEAVGPSDTGPTLDAEAECWLSGLTHISAVREGMSEAFPIPDMNADGQSDVGVDGRFAAYWYDRLVDTEVPETRRCPSEPASSFRKQLDAWLGMLFPGAQANVQMTLQIPMLSLQFRLSDIGAWLRPANVGYGLTYAFPILVALLSAECGQIIVIDSPEAHLHPFAQSQMGRVLAHFANAGIQILVETHSDHLLNGARLAVRQKIISKRALQLHFFTGPKASEHGVISPSLDVNGRIDEWPDGFFDQSEKDLARLAGWE